MYMSSKLYPDYPVLIVDDEEHVVASQEDVLKSHGISNLMSTMDSREVAGILSGNEVELVLLDLFLMEYLSPLGIVIQRLMTYI